MANNRQPPLRIVKKATPASVAFDIGTHPMHFAQCRALGHSWQHRAEPYNDETDGFSVPIGVSSGTVGLVSTCSNCGGSRIKWLSRSGEVFSRYRYADGYQTRGENITQMDWRRSFVVRLFPEEKRSRRRA